MLKERIIYLFLITVALTTGIKSILPVKQNSDLEKKQFWINKTFANNNHDIVIIGDSRTYRGIDTKIVSKSNGALKVLNFGYSSAGFSKLFIQEAVSKLDENGKKIILLGVSPFSLTNEALNNEHYFTEKKHKKEEILESKYFASVMRYFDKYNPQYLLDHRYLKEKDEEKADDFYHEIYNDGGWVASWKNKVDYTQAIASYKKSFARTDINSKNLNESIEYLSELIKTGYTVYAVRPPISKELLKIEEEFAGTKYDVFKTNLLKVGVKWIELPLITDSTYDGSHLDIHGAKKFSLQIANMMK